MQKPFSNQKICQYTNLDEISTRKKYAIKFSTGLPTDILKIDPFHVFCNDSQCLNLKEGLPLYSDQNHLSQYFH